MAFRFSDHQKSTLQQEVLHGEGLRPSPATVHSLATRLNLPVKKVSQWFSNCRLGNYPFCRHMVVQARNRIAGPVGNDDDLGIPSALATAISKHPADSFSDDDVDEPLQRPSSKKAALSASDKLRQIDEQMAELEAQEAFDRADRTEKSAAYQEASRVLNEACVEQLKTSAAFTEADKTHTATRRKLWQLRDERLELLELMEQ